MHPEWYLLTYGGYPTDVGDDNRTFAQKPERAKLPGRLVPPGKNIDEFPYASTEESYAYRDLDLLGIISTRIIDAVQNQAEGRHLGMFYRGALESVPGKKFLVVPVPMA